MTGELLNFAANLRLQRTEARMNSQSLLSTSINFGLIRAIGGINCCMLRRPQSLAEIARESSVLEDFGRHVRDFLHEWNRAKREGKHLGAVLGEEPRVLASVFPQGNVCDAFLAALAEHLAEQAAIVAPDWVRGAGRHLA